MKYDDIEPSPNKAKSLILQIFSYMSEAERRKLISGIIAKSSAIDHKQVLSLLISNMSESANRNLLKYLEKWHKFKIKETREHSRKPSFIPVECASEGASFTDFIQDISNGGVFIQTTGNFYIGQQITLTFSLPKVADEIQVGGEVVRLDAEGIGVKFHEPLTFI
ncbi:MAG: PilZ domain-containing protein [Desulfobacterales bacterium]|nr:MAG: PilZ domain-containing protein [Desulfobacterales bacterium]